jgi:AcrR family transcriptional regulator
MMDAIHEHERCYFMYFFFEIYGRASAAARQGKTIFRPIDEFRKRGLDFADFDGMAFVNDREPPGYPRTMQMVLLMETFYAATVFFMMKDHIEGGGRRETLDRIVTEKINTGLGFPVSELHNMDFAALDSLLVFEAAPSNPLLDAVGRAVAEAGPWGASMEMVARFAGLSKSGLYSHFASRGEMMGELFRSELDAIDRTVKKTVPAGRNAGESFYLSLAAVAGYLLSKPAILDAFDWLKARQPWSPRRRLERHCVPADAPGVRVLNGLFSQVTRPDKSPYLNDIDTYFVVFMIVNILARRPVKSGADAEPRRFCVPMFKFLAAGLQGLEE